MRSYRRRRFASRRTVRRVGRRRRLMLKRMLLRRRIKRFVNKMGYPTYVKMIGMTESKRLLLRKTLTLDANYSTLNESKDGNPSTNVFQIILNPLECPNINKIYTDFDLKQNNDGDYITYHNVFKYDYLKVRNIFISIKPAQTVSTSNTNLYSNDADNSGISNVYAYFTYKYPILSGVDQEDVITQMYGTDPLPDRIIQEGRLKNVYSWPSNKAMTISLNTLRYRVISEPFKLCSNSPLDIQYLNTLCPNNKNSKIYDPFNFSKFDSSEEEEDSNNDNNDNNDNNKMEREANQGRIFIPDLASREYNLFFGRLVIVSPKKIRFTTEICYDCALFR